MSEKTPFISVVMPIYNEEKYISNFLESLISQDFPVENMYGAVAIFSYIVPVRYYFLIYIDQALNGISLYYSRYYFVALAIFPLIASTMLWRLKKACRKPIYLP